jgi:hypothetical protein
MVRKSSTSDVRCTIAQFRCTAVRGESRDIYPSHRIAQIPADAMTTAAPINSMGRLWRDLETATTPATIVATASSGITPARTAM